MNLPQSRIEVNSKVFRKPYSRLILSEGEAQPLKIDGGDVSIYRAPADLLGLVSIRPLNAGISLGEIGHQPTIPLGSIGENGDLESAKVVTVVDSLLIFEGLLRGDEAFRSPVYVGGDGETPALLDPPEYVIQPDSCFMESMAPVLLTQAEKFQEMVPMLF